MRHNLHAKTGRALLLACGLAVGLSGCGNSQTSGDTAAIAQGNKSASEAWEKAKADGSDKHRAAPAKQGPSNKRGH